MNIERKLDNSFVICIAYLESERWKARTMAGISGDLDNDKLVDQVIKYGSPMDFKTASSIFSDAANNFAEYGDSK